ncbi:hypothetical protein [Treponema sp.]|uniref:hypothetical protein n=1 Tax=Treponema sp. TaxID=166 RepID=UPI003FD7538E
MLNRIRKLKVLKPLKIFYRYFRFGKCPSFSKPKFFLNNSKNQETACFILAGYKSFTWKIVFKRIKTFCPENIDVCIVSSGIFSEELLNITTENSWSYLTTKKNNVCLALNSAIKNFPSAKNIFKLDEDIFVTKDFFTNLPKIHEESKEKYFPCFTAPLIPINGFCYSKILEKLNLIEEYKKHFEEPRVSAGSWMQIENNLEVAKFFWGKKNFVPQIDELNKRLRKIGGGVSNLSNSFFNRCNFFRA